MGGALKKLKFKPEDFKDCVEGVHELSGMFDCGNAIDEYKCAKLANAMFDKWYRENIEGTQVVYGFKTDSGRWLWDTDRGNKDTHTAICACVVEIKK